MGIGGAGRGRVPPGFSYMVFFGLILLFFGLFSLPLPPGNQETANGPFRSSSQAAACYYQSNRSKVEAIPLSAFPKDTTSEIAA